MHGSEGGESVRLFPTPIENETNQGGIWIPACAGMSAPVRAFCQHGESPCPGKPKPGNRRKLRRHEAGWRATGGERSVRRITNPIRRSVCGEPAHPWRSLKLIIRVGLAVKTADGQQNVVGDGTIRRHNAVSGETCSPRRRDTGVRVLI